MWPSSWVYDDTDHVMNYWALNVTVLMEKNFIQQNLADQFVGKC